jgi:hypothetical protein
LRMRGKLHGLILTQNARHSMKTPPEAGTCQGWNGSLNGTTPWNISHGDKIVASFTLHGLTS